MLESPQNLDIGTCSKCFKLIEQDTYLEIKGTFLNPKMKKSNFLKLKTS